MNYHFNTEAIVDITKPPYNADNTGKTDCTGAVRKALDDILIRNIIELEAFYNEVKEKSGNFKYDYYAGFEAARIDKGNVMITFPYFRPKTKIIYFPNGEYLVSDTLTYTLQDLKNKYYYKPEYEMNYNINFLGESREGTVIRLCDNAEGFNERRAVISFYPRNIGDNTKEVSNIAFSNTVRDLTIDTGRGNPGAIGIRYHSSNCGRIENTKITGDGYAGIETVYGSQAVFDNIEISGFDYGFEIVRSQMLALDLIECAGCKKAAIHTSGSPVNCNRVNCGALPLFDLFVIKGHENDFQPFFTSRCYVSESAKITGDLSHSCIIKAGSGIAEALRNIPTHPEYQRDDIAFVDAFGAIGDGKTDCSRAIQAAFDSGKPMVLFGYGQYFINDFIYIPASVKVIDFLYCDLAGGARIIGGEVSAPFVISEDSPDTLFVENIITWEQYYGHSHLFCHSARRDAVFKNMHVFMSHLYTNTVSGSRVYFDNCFTTAGTYTKSSVIKRGNLKPVYSAIIPYEFHSQTVYARQLNAERADLAVLNDNSDALFDCLRTEGPGTAVKSIGGRTQINLSHSGIGQFDAENPLFDINGSCEINGADCSGYNSETEYNVVISDNGNTIHFTEADCVENHQSLLKRYANTKENT